MPGKNRLTLTVNAWLPIVASGVMLTAGCTHTASPSGEAAMTPGWADLGAHRRPVSGASSEAQRHFDQGLVWLYSFNHAEAIRHFSRAAELSPACAMAHWALALAHGPHINNPAMTERQSLAAWEALRAALRHSPAASGVERDLIEALRVRYADPAEGPLPLDPPARAPFDLAYADAMARVYKRYPSDRDVATLYAESLMDLRPWDLWSLEGTPRPETPEVLRLLQEVLASDPEHPGANHLYIHAVEASPRPELADGAAERLRTLVPASGHMVHMPSHIDVRLGRWAQAADQNEAAMRVHAAYRLSAPASPGTFYGAYMFHNQHFLAYACMMEGRGRDAISAARGMVASIPDSFLRDYGPIADAYTGIISEALIRFGRWDEVLREPEPRAELPITRVLWRHARGVALAAKGEIGAARAEQSLFRARAAALPPGAMMAINPASRVLTLADHMLEGEILYREGRLDEAVARLRAAVEIEDSLMYMEPPDWPVPVRHALGAILLEAGRTDAAQAVYAEDLRRWPENGWSLFGMSRCREALGDAVGAADYRRRQQHAWRRADTRLTASCLCVKGGMDASK